MLTTYLFAPLMYSSCTLHAPHMHPTLRCTLHAHPRMHTRAPYMHPIRVHPIRLHPIRPPLYTRAPHTPMFLYASYTLWKCTWDRARSLFKQLYRLVKMTIYAHNTKMCFPYMQTVFHNFVATRCTFFAVNAW